MPVALCRIDAERQISIRYEDLLSNPVNVIKTLFDFVSLEIPVDHVDMIKSLKTQQRTPEWKSNGSSEELKEVINIQDSLLGELGYL